MRLSCPSFRQPTLTCEEFSQRIRTGIIPNARRMVYLEVRSFLSKGRQRHGDRSSIGVQHVRFFRRDMNTPLRKFRMMIL